MFSGYCGISHDDCRFINLVYVTWYVPFACSIFLWPSYLECFSTWGWHPWLVYRYVMQTVLTWVRYENNTALIQWIGCEPLGGHFSHWTLDEATSAKIIFYVEKMKKTALLKDIVAMWPSRGGVCIPFQSFHPLCFWIVCEYFSFIWSWNC